MVTTDHPGVIDIRGELAVSAEPRDLTQDVLEIELDNGVFIDVGWYPEHDPHGQYHIRAFLECWENQITKRPIRVASTEEAIEVVDGLVKCLSGNLISVSLSSSLQFDEPTLV